MNRFFSLVLIYPVIILVTLSVLLINYERNAYDEFAQLRLSAMMNHANDAAMQVARKSGQINAQGESEIDAKSVWETYKKVFLSGMGTGGDFEEQAFEFSTPAAVLAVNDGMYLKEPYYGTFVSHDKLTSADKGLQFKYFPIGSTHDPYNGPSSNIDNSYKQIIKENEKKTGYSWSQKIPFVRNLVGEEMTVVNPKAGDPKTLTALPTIMHRGNTAEEKERLRESYPFLVLDKINGKNLYIMDYNTYEASNKTNSGFVYKFSSTDSEKVNYIPKLELVENGTLEFLPENSKDPSKTFTCSIHNTQKINEQICNATAHLVNKAKDVYDNKSFYIPTQFEEETKYSTVAFKGLTLIVLIQDYDPYHTSRSLSNYSISSSALVIAKPIYCYIKDSKKVYSYNKPSSGTSYIVASSRREAAQKGYYPDASIYQMY